METETRIVLLAVLILDLVAFGLAVAAENLKSKGSQVDDGMRYSCLYNSDVSTVLGVISFGFLLAAQVLVMVPARCLYFGKYIEPGKYRIWIKIWFFKTWISFIIAEAFLMIGSVENTHRTKETTLITEAPPTCKSMKKGVFGTGAAFVFGTWMASSMFYRKYVDADIKNPPPSQNRDMGGVRMGQPQP